MNRHIRHIFNLCFIALVLFGAVSARADIKGTVSGIITDPSGAVVPQGTVVATNVDTGVKSSTATDGKGFYVFPALNVGTYKVEINQTGFSTYQQSNIKIDANS